MSNNSENTNIESNSTNIKVEFSDEIVVLFTNLFRKIVREEMSNYMKEQSIEKFIDLSVKEVSDDSLSATLVDLVTGELYEDIPNHTNIELQAKDIVRMYTGSGQNYIGLTFGDRTKYLCVDKSESE